MCIMNTIFDLLNRYIYCSPFVFISVLYFIHVLYIHVTYVMDRSLVNIYMTYLRPILRVHSKVLVCVFVHP